MLPVKLSFRPLNLRRPPSSKFSVFSHFIYISSRNMAAMKRKADTAAVFDSKKPKTDSAITSFFGAPKPTSTPSSAKAASSVESAPMTKFNKDKWVATLSDEQKKLLKLEIDTLDESWLSHLKEHIITPEFLNLKRFLQKEIDSGKKIYPPLEDVYSWYVLSPVR